MSQATSPSAKKCFGIRAAMRRALRIMRDYELLAHQRSVAVRGPQVHDGTIVTDWPDLMWAIDATGCLTDEGNATVFVLVDHCTGECLGVRAAPRGARSPPCPAGAGTSGHATRHRDGGGALSPVDDGLQGKLTARAPVDVPSADAAGRCDAVRAVRGRHRVVGVASAASCTG